MTLAGKIRHFAVTILTLCLLSPAIAVAGNAPIMADQACDPNFMDAVESKGWMETQREVTQNMNLIYKPDSVLEYTCFQQMLEIVAVVLAPRFSESVQWSPAAGFTEVSTDIALEEVVGKALIAYLQNNFPHTYRGGRVPVSTDPPRPRDDGQYLCDAMNYVWMQSHCSMFGEQQTRFQGTCTQIDPVTGNRVGCQTQTLQEVDGFYDFAFFAQNSIRRVPPQFASCNQPQNAGDPAPLLALYNQTAKSAFNENSGAANIGDVQNNMFMLPTENQYTPALYEDDQLLTHLQYILQSDSCGRTGTPIANPIPTGIQVQRREAGKGIAAPVADYPEHICPVPGCSFNGTECEMNPTPAAPP